jgi:hypothetical protein
MQSLVPVLVLPASNKDFGIFVTEKLGIDTQEGNHNHFLVIQIAYKNLTDRAGGAKIACPVTLKY